jgi:two-component system LytT family response regulator
MTKDFLVVSDNRVVHKIPIVEIEHVESQGMRSFIHISNGIQYACSKNMGEIFKMLDATNTFYRIDTSFTVNLTKIVKVQKDKSAFVIMSNGKVIPISKRRKMEFFRRYFG